MYVHIILEGVVSLRKGRELMSFLGRSRSIYALFRNLSYLLLMIIWLSLSGVLIKSNGELIILLVFRVGWSYCGGKLP